MFDKVANFLMEGYVLYPMIGVLVLLIVVLVVMRMKRDDDDE